ncbi:MAG: type II secretion system protein GspK [Proteobacteria bacterium]|nr:type II secretion system protein GspK [Pseudomonadota bacterium]
MAKLHRLGGWKTRLAGRQGLALIAVLWGVTLLAVIATSFTTTTRTETKLALNLIENTKAKALADAGIYRAVLALIEDRRISLRDNEAFEDAALEGEDDTLVRLEFGTAREAESPDEAESPGAFLHADATPYRWGFAGAEVVIAVQDEGGKINLNGAEELVEALLRSAGLGPGAASDLADAIADFGDEDDLPRAGGAEDADYRAAGFTHGAKDAPFESVDELKLVLGMDDALYGRIAPLVTVYVSQHEVNPETAPAGVLRVLRGEPLAGIDGSETEESPSFMADGFDAAPDLSSFAGGGLAEVYTIRSEARLEGGAVFVREAVVELTGEAHRRPYWFLAWRQGKRAPAALRVSE